MAIISSKDGNSFGWVAEETHVHVTCDNVLGLGKVLVEMGARGTFANTIEVINVHKLRIIGEARIGEGKGTGVRYGR